MKDEDKFICDCCAREAFGQLSLHFWYGSQYDMNQGTAHLCDSCGDKMIKYVKDTFKIKNFLKNIEEF